MRVCVCVFFLLLVVVDGGVVVYLFFESLGVDVELSSSPSDLQRKPLQLGHSMNLENNVLITSDDGLEHVFGFSCGSLWCSWGRFGSPLGGLGGLLGPLWRPQLDQEVRLGALDGFC